MIQNNNGNRYRSYKTWIHSIHEPYDYETYGITTKILSPKIYNSKNRILKIVLISYERALLIVNKTVDLLNNYHNYLWRNR